MTDQISTSAKWGLGIAAGVLTAVIVAFVFGGIEANQTLAVVRTEVTALKATLDEVRDDLRNRPRYDANQAVAKEQAQAVTDAAQNKIIELLTSVTETMDKRQVGFEARLRKLESGG